MKKSAILLVAFVALVSCNKEKRVSLSNDDLKTFYSVGHTMGQRMQNLKLSDEEISAVTMGLRDAAAGKKAEVNVDEFRMKIQALFKGRIEKAAESEKKQGEDFLAKAAKEEGAQKTESGLVYKVLKEGTGAMPKATDTVEVHYEGKLINGEIFDSSLQRGKPVTFPLNQVIKGWTEGVQKVKEGGKIKLVIPSDLAYGTNGAPPKIPGGATLVFEVELLKIVKAEEKKK
ncbi:MAG: FKBP-type peptidyl-prolyl cis-trans isomerase [Bdellovibrionota bacterium]|jgi:FKBP-type peptidyl-prolyl cis-trans isomerase FkpA|nr:FKBP-type peptidyl-prolyl cis-trans isomerase [Bdellovibrionota bacterium]